VLYWFLLTFYIYLLSLFISSHFSSSILAIYARKNAFYCYADCLRFASSFRFFSSLSELSVRSCILFKACNNISLTGLHLSCYPQKLNSYWKWSLMDNCDSILGLSISSRFALLVWRSWRSIIKVWGHSALYTTLEFSSFEQIYFISWTSVSTSWKHFSFY